MSRTVKPSKTHFKRKRAPRLRREIIVEAESARPGAPGWELVVFGKDMTLDEIEAYIRARMGWDEQR